VNAAAHLDRLVQSHRMMLVETFSTCLVEKSWSKSAPIRVISF
jgi:hypothetical protein